MLTVSAYTQYKIIELFYIFVFVLSFQNSVYILQHIVIRTKHYFKYSIAACG